MKSFFERLKSNTEKNPNHVILRSEGYPDGITYKQLDDLSGRICNYLKSKNIGKEDFVMILMPREASAYISVIGVWKSGAAMILLEEDYSPERAEFIKSDLNCKLVITQAVFDEMMKCEPVSEYDLPLPHDACYASYTSGSTGNPKGILHEFGKLDTFVYDYNGKLLPVSDGNFAIITPLNFGPSVRNAVTSLLYGKCIFIVPGNVVKNPKLLSRYFDNNRISDTSVTSSFFRAYPIAGKYMKNIFVHSEPCTGIYKDGVNIIGVYMLSEVVFPVFSFRIDKPYENAPLGYKNKNFNIKIVDENGMETKPFEKGEIIVEDPFTRGYVNLPDKTAQAFVGGFFHTGDLGYFDDNEMAFLCGRKDDMIKIYGNRIEPLEIEACVKRVLSVKNALAKGFTDEKRSFIAVYFLKDELAENSLLGDDGEFVYSASQMRGKLKSMLPDYMIPLYYTVSEAYPKNANGKLSRRDLPKPMASDYLKGYASPQNDTEAYFCHLFETVLKLEKVGANDDFYQIGGDSLASIAATVKCEKFELSVTDILNERTPRALSKTVLKAKTENETEKQNREALLFAQPLLPEQRATFEGQSEYSDFNLNNLTRFFKLNDKTDIYVFKAAVDKVLRHHPVFSSVLINDNGVEKLLYKPELYKETEIITIDKKKLENIINNPCKNFRLENSLLYRHAIYLCDNKKYFFLEIHHLITDGISLKSLFNEISRCHKDENLTLPTDYFFYLLRSYNDKKTKISVTPEKIRELYNAEGFTDRNYNTVKTDKLLNGYTPANFEKVLDIQKDKLLKSDIFDKYGGNVFFLTCFLKTAAEYNKTNKAFSFWVYGGRENKYEQNAHGMLIRTMPMGIELDDFSQLRSVFEYVKSNSERYVSAEIPFINGYTDCFTFTPYFVYQKDVIYSNDGEDVFESEINLQGGATPFEFYVIDNTGKNDLRCKVKYSADLYFEKSIEKFCAVFEKTVNEIIDGNK